MGEFVLHVILCKRGLQDTHKLSWYTHANYMYDFEYITVFCNILRM